MSKTFYSFPKTFTHQTDIKIDPPKPDKNIIYGWNQGVDIDATFNRIKEYTNEIFKNDFQRVFYDHMKQMLIHGTSYLDMESVIRRRVNMVTEPIDCFGYPLHVEVPKNALRIAVSTPNGVDNSWEAMYKKRFEIKNKPSWLNGEKEESKVSDFDSLIKNYYPTAVKQPDGIVFQGPPTLDSLLETMQKRLPGMVCKIEITKGFLSGDGLLKLTVKDRLYGFKKELFIRPVHSNEFFLRAFNGQLGTIHEELSQYIESIKDNIDELERRQYIAESLPNLPEHYYAF